MTPDHVRAVVDEILKEDVPQGHVPAHLTESRGGSHHPELKRQEAPT